MERDADLLVLGLPYRKRFGGDFAIGRTIPYVLKHAPCEVWSFASRYPPSEPALAAANAGGKEHRCSSSSSAVGALAPRWPSTRLRRSRGRTSSISRTRAFDRLADDFKGQAPRGDGTDEDALRKAGADGADVFRP